MGILLGVVAVLAILFWLFVPHRRVTPAPEDDTETSIDHERLAEAERELADDSRARPLEHGIDDEEDDWGPGTV